MLKSRRIPTWLARRSYFKRIERWTKIGKPRKAASEACPAPMPSNVVPFPIRPNRPERPAFEALRGVGTA